MLSPCAHPQPHSQVAPLLLVPWSRNKIETKNLYEKNNGAYADNYSSSFQTEPEYVGAKDEMNRIHSKIGLPLKGTYCADHTDKNVLKELEKEKDAEPTY